MNESNKEISGKEYLKDQYKLIEDKTSFGFSSNGTPKICVDECVGVIEICDEKVVYVNYDFENRKKPTDYPSIPSIVIIIENPHFDEFTKGKDEGSPARGCTGNNLQKYLLFNLYKYLHCNDQGINGIYSFSNKKIANGKYKIIVSNAVQYQCSLGLPLNGKNSNGNREETNKRFTACLNKDKNIFISRIKGYKPKVIINSCTGQNKGEIAGLQREVQDVLQENIQNVLFLHSAHPSSVYFLEGFKEV